MTLPYALLSLLSDGPAHAYALHATYNAETSPSPPVLATRVRAALRQLTGEGKVVGRHVAQVGRPDKIVYEVTLDGQYALRDWLATPSLTDPGDCRDLPLKLWVARKSALTDVRELIVREIDACAARLREVEAALPEAVGAHALSLKLSRGQFSAVLQWLRECEQTWTREGSL